MIKNDPVRALRFMGIAIFGLIFYWTVKNGTGQQRGYVLVIGILIWATARFLLPRENADLHRTRRAMMGILLLGVFLRLIYALVFPTPPVSDFEFYVREALQLVQGQVGQALPKNPGYVLALSLGFRLHPGWISGKLINLVSSSVSILILYLLGERLKKPRVGLMAAFLYAIFPAEIEMVTVLGTDVMATTVLAAAVYFFILGVGGNDDHYIYFAALLLGLGITIRASILFFSPAFVGALVLVRLREFKRLVISASVFLVSLGIFPLLLATWHSLSIGHAAVKLFSYQSSFPLLTGTNLDSQGLWTPEDAELYYSWPAADRDRMAREKAWRRVSENPGRFMRMIPAKYETLLGQSDYGYYWSIRPIDWERHKLPGDIIKRLAVLIEQSTYILFVGLACYRFIDSQDREPEIPAMAIASVVSLLVPFSIFEVQSRYHHLILPFIILAAGDGLLRIIRRVEGVGKLLTSGWTAGSP
ncbi:MAG TPA: glycosyltransferase family 39 protein [Anaerolineales bacterium]